MSKHTKRLGKKTEKFPNVKKSVLVQVSNVDNHNRRAAWTDLCTFLETRRKKSLSSFLLLFFSKQNKSRAKLIQKEINEIIIDLAQLPILFH